MPLLGVYETTHSYFLLHDYRHMESYSTINDYSSKLMTSSNLDKKVKICSLVIKILKNEISLSRHKFCSAKFSASNYLIETPVSSSSSLFLHGTGSIMSFAKKEERKKANVKFLKTMNDYFSFILNPEIEEPMVNKAKSIFPMGGALDLPCLKSSTNTTNNTTFMKTDNFQLEFYLSKVISSESDDLESVLERFEEEFDALMMDMELEEGNSIQGLLSIDRLRKGNLENHVERIFGEIQEEIGESSSMRVNSRPFGPKAKLRILSDKFGSKEKKRRIDTTSRDMDTECDLEEDNGSVLMKMMSMERKGQTFKKSLMMDVKLRNEEAQLTFRDRQK